MDLYAPNSQYTDKNNSSLTGDFVIGYFTASQNGSITYQGPSTGAFGGTTTTTPYYPSAQQICTTASTC